MSEHADQFENGPDEGLQEEQRGKGYGEDEGEREPGLEEDAAESGDAGDTRG